MLTIAALVVLAILAYATSDAHQHRAHGENLVLLALGSIALALAYFAHSAIVYLYRH